MHKKLPGGRSSAPDPAGEQAYSTHPDSPAGGEGEASPLRKNPTPVLGPLRLQLRPYEPRISPPPNPHDRFTPLNTVKSKVIRNQSIKAD